jgi:hemolysin III
VSLRLVGTQPRPRLRGASHALAAVAAIPAGVWLVRQAPSTCSRLATVLYAVTTTSLFTVSAAYHLGRWIDGSRRRLKAADHVTIFCFMAGSYGPLGVLRLSAPAAGAWLGALWLGALVGGVVKVRTLDRLGGPADLLYGVMGGSALLLLPALVHRLDKPQLVLLVGGLLWYGLSAYCLKSRRPDPWPRTFGYHECAHLCVVGGALTHVAFYAMLFK